uniref:hypothetical protein n=1 Tax=Flavobacterium sp. TaxID=239 RepID=UPI00404AC743
MNNLLQYDRDAIDIFDVQCNEIDIAFSEPDRIEDFNVDTYLYFKDLNLKNSRKSKILLCTNHNNRESKLIFSLWIPNEIYSSKVALTAIVQIFVNSFGLRIRVGEIVGFFIPESIRYFSGNLGDNKITSPLIEILAPKEVPYFISYGLNESLIGLLNTVTFYNLFALNIWKYSSWLKSIPMKSVEIDINMYEKIKYDIIDFLNPNGKTQISIKRQKGNKILEVNNSIKKTLIEVPSLYHKQCEYIIEQVNDLRINERYSLEISNSQPVCLFCDSENVSKEHIFPKWLRSFITEEKSKGNIYAPLKNEPLEDYLLAPLTNGKTESNHGLTTKHVCTDCNSGWMSRLENVVKSILIENESMVDNISCQINSDNAEKLSHWLIIKSILLKNKLLFGVSEIPKEILSDLKKGIVDQGFLVEVTHAKTSKFDFQIRQGFDNKDFLNLSKISFERAAILLSEFITCTIQLNYLIFRVTFLRKEVPFSRGTIFKRTIKLFPFNADIIHEEIIDEEIEWSKVSTNLEFKILCEVGIILSENSKK